MALLDGLLHCYTPSLGPTGYRLIDRGPRRIHGVADTGITSSSWRGSANRWCLRGTNANAERFSGCGTFPLGDRTVIGWFRCQVSLAQFADNRFLFAAGGMATSTGFIIFMFHGVPGTGIGVTQIGDAVVTNLGNDNIWHCVGATNKGSLWQVYFDGALVGSKTLATSQDATAPAIMGKDGWWWDGDAGEIAWWNRILTPSEFREIYRQGDGAIGRTLTGQAFPRRRLSQAIAAGGATPWLYARRRSQIIGSGGVH